MARSTLMKLGFRYPRMDLCCLAERVDGLNGNNEMLSKLPHHDIIILFQNDKEEPERSYLQVLFSLYFIEST